MARGKQSSRQPPPQGEIRQSQIVTTFGPGAMVDLIDDAVLIGGLDVWSMGPGRGVPISEPRLRARVVSSLRAQGADDDRVELSPTTPFRAPPAGDSGAPTPAVGIKAFEFPRWFVCGSCHALVRKDQLDYKSKAYWHACIGRTRGRATPVRFVSTCRRGHLSDFPWVRFVHGQGDVCSHSQLRLTEGSSGDFSEVLVHCDSCGQSRPLSQGKHAAAMPFCYGDRPWLGADATEECTERQTLMVRTASNSWFGQVMSALTIPDLEDPLRHRLEPFMEWLGPADAESLPVIRRIYRDKLAPLSELRDEEILRSLERARQGSPNAHLFLRTPEFRRFMGEPLELPGERHADDDTFFARRARLSSLPPQIDRVVLATKLREVRTLIGFTRLEAATPTLQGEFDLGVEPARISLHQDWLPATEVNGEGLLLVLREDAIAQWEARPEVVTREEELAAGYQRYTATLERRDGRSPPPFPGARFYLLHTLSHMLVTALSLDCGYAASAIRERIYCSAPGDEERMAAILLSTGTAGSEGTLGGLVDQGRRIVHHLAHAWDLATLCSGDPVCAHHSPHGDHGEQYLMGAACHGCLFIAECSCERFNKYLDRALVVPVIGKPRALAFFGERPGA